MNDYKTVDINPRDPVTGARPLPQWARINQTQSNSDLKYGAIYTKLEKRSATATSSSSRTRGRGAPTTHRSRATSIRSITRLTSARRTANGAMPVVASGSVLLPYNITVGAVWTARSQLPWSALAGRDLNGDTFNTDLVPGTVRNSGSRDLNLAAVNVYRAANGLAAVSDSQIDSSALSIADMRVSKSIKLQGTMKLDSGAAGVQRPEHQESAGPVRGRARHQCVVGELRPDPDGAADGAGRDCGQAERGSQADRQAAAARMAAMQ